MNSFSKNLPSQLKHYMTKIAFYKSTSIFGILAVLILVFAILSPNHSFISGDSIRIILSIGSIVGLVTLGMTLLLITGEFDLSVGAVYAFSAVVVALLLADYNIHPVIAILIALLAGAGMGAINGVVTTKLGVSSLITTLGTMWVFRGIILVVTSGYSVSYHPEAVSACYRNVFAGEIGGIPVPFLWLIAATIVLWVLLEHTRFGNWIFVTGSNKYSARMMGINTDNVKIICFMIVGLLAALAGVIQASRISSGVPTAGSMMNLKAIAGSVVGGASLLGGVGSIVGALFGATIIRVLGSGLIMLGFSQFYFNISLGLLLIVAVIINVRVLRRTRI